MLLDAASPPIKAHGPTPLDVCVCVCVCVCVYVMLILAPNTLWCFIMLNIRIQFFAAVSKVSSVAHVSSPLFVRRALISLWTTVVPQACSYLLLATMAS